MLAMGVEIQVEDIEQMVDEECIEVEVKVVKGSNGESLRSRRKSLM